MPSPPPRRRRSRRGPPSSSRDCCGHERSERHKRRPRADRRAAGQLRRRGQRRHVRIRQADPRRRAARQFTATLWRILRRSGRQADHRARRGRLQRRRRTRRGVPRRAHPRGAPRAPGRGCAGIARRRSLEIRTVPWCLGGALPQLRRPRAARGLPADVDHAQPADSRRGGCTRCGSPCAVAVFGLPHHGLARAGDLRLLRHRVRRAPIADPHRDARRLGRPSATQGLPVGRHPRGVSRGDDPPARRAEVLQLMTQQDVPETVITVGGEDWDDVVKAARDSGVAGERIVVNMGPQHPSTHGVLRLILEIDGETITEARCGIGYLHTGIEKNLEYRNWTQGVTFVTRMDYLSPFFNETAYCLGVEKLLDVTDDIPERATVIRVMLMELNRISSHLVALATGGMELGAMSAMFFGFLGRELVLAVFETITGLRMNHAYIRPGGVAVHLPDEAMPQLEELLRTMPDKLTDLENLLNENYLWKARTVGVGYLDLTGCMALGITGPILRSTGLPHDLRRAQPYCGYENYEVDVITTDECDAYRRYLIRVREMRESLKIVEQCVDRLKPGPVMLTDKKLAWPADLKLGPDGLGNSNEHIAKIMGGSMEALIHHFKLVTEGIRVPAGQVYVAVESPRGELGVHMVSDGGTRPYRVHYRDPSFTNLQAVAAMCEGGMVADAISAVASIDSVMGGVDR